MARQSVKSGGWWWWWWLAFLMTILMTVAGLSACRFNSAPAVDEIVRAPSIAPQPTGGVSRPGTDNASPVPLVLSDFAVNSVRYQGDTWPVLSCKLSPAVEFVYWQACRVDKLPASCQEGIVDHSSHVITSLAAGAYQLTVRPCRYVLEGKLVAQQCGLSSERIFVQNEPVQVRLSKLLEERYQKAQHIRQLGPRVYEAVVAAKQAIGQCPDRKVTALIPPKTFTDLEALGPDGIGLGLLNPEASLVIEQGEQRLITPLGSGLHGDANVQNGSDADGQSASGADGQSHDNDHSEGETTAKLTFLSGALTVIGGVAGKYAIGHIAETTKKAGSALFNKINGGPSAAAVAPDAPTDALPGAAGPAAAGAQPAVSKAKAWVRPVLVGLGVATAIGLVVYAVYNKEGSWPDLAKEYFNDVLRLSSSPCATVLAATETIAELNGQAVKLRSELRAIEMLAAQESEKAKSSPP